ncbi:flagellar protein FlaG [Aromatoleum evansii]|uniref:flagellar protein FlaG n=1 Tax=Aromatoleum evansii TaxID=59406 RepID=UPI00145FA7CC|nr:flagellar protein FlaG [Aromatoleum evansii]NMG32176.1 flagellar protein [Aromatoleum evansii]
MSIQSVNLTPPVVTPPKAHTTEPAASTATGLTAATDRPREAQAADVQTAATPPSSDDIIRALDEVREAVKPVAQSLHFSLDQDTGRTVVKVMDTETNEMIRQIPSEDILKIAQAIDKLQGLLIKQQA